MCSIAAGLGLVSAGISAYGAMYQANAQAAGLKAQAKWQDRAAHVERMKTSYAVMQERRRTQSMLGTQQLQYTASGIDTSAGGTPTQVAEATVLEREMDVQARRMEGKEAANKYNYDAGMSRMNAEGVQKAGQINALGSLISGAAGAAGSLGTSLTGNAFQIGQANSYQSTPAVATVPAMSGVNTMPVPTPSPGYQRPQPFGRWPY